MNWYKTAKLLDKDKRNDVHLFTACMFCNRWQTDEAPEWKTLDKLEDLEDREKAQDALDSVVFNPKHTGISHGICPYCTKILEEKGWPKTQEDIEEVTARSLSYELV